MNILRLSIIALANRFSLGTHERNVLGFRVQITLLKTENPLAYPLGFPILTLLI